MQLSLVQSLLLLSSIACSLAKPVIENTIRDSFNGYNNDCVNYYGRVCNNATIFEVFSQKASENNIHKAYESLKQSLIDVLGSKEINGINFIDNESPAIKLEKQLYESCMKLGSNAINDKNDNNIVVNDLYSLKNIFNPIFKRFGGKVLDENIKWQTLIEELSELGLGHVLFDISVSKYSENSNKSIILIQPPSLKKWNSVNILHTVLDTLYYFQAKVFSHCVKIGRITIAANESIDELQHWESMAFTDKRLILEPDVAETMCKTVEPMREMKKHKTILNIAEDSDNLVLLILKNIISFKMKELHPRKDITQHKFYTIKTWNDTFNALIKQNESKIDWSRLIKSEFSRAGISVDDNEQVFVRNVPYFDHLARVVRSSFIENIVIVQLIYSIIVVENIQYYDWKFAHKTNFKDKSSFCFEETKLYGLSESLLKSAMKKNQNSINSVSQNIVNGVVQVFKEKISKAQGLTEVDKNTLNADLVTITESLSSTDHTINFSYKDNDNITITGDYVLDIKKYDRAVKNMILRSLRKNVSLSSLQPFSINNLDNNRNRFLLHTALEVYNQGIPRPHPFIDIGKEARYATFGINLAKFLYTLLIENENINEFRNRHGSEALLPRNSYSAKAVKCFVSEDIVKYGYQLAYSTISEIFSVRIASEALKKNSESLSLEEFYEAYIRTQCDTSGKMIKKVLSNLDEVPESLNCSFEKISGKCRMDIFENDLKQIAYRELVRADRNTGGINLQHRGELSCAIMQVDSK